MQSMNFFNVQTRDAQFQLRTKLCPIRLPTFSLKLHLFQRFFPFFSFLSSMSYR